MFLLHTESLSKYGLHRIFHFAKDAGFDGIELAINPKRLDTQNPKYLKKLSEETGVKIIAVQAPAYATKQKMEIAYRTAQEVGAQVITVQPPSYFDYRSVSWLKTNAPKLRNRGNFHVALVNTPDERTFGILPRHALSALKDMREFREITLDTSNLVSRHVPLLEFYERMHKFIYHVHLSNYRGDHDHAHPTEGRLPLESLLKKMKKQSYPGHFSLKVRPAELHAGKDDEEVIRYLQKAKEFFTEYFQ